MQWFSLCISACPFISKLQRRKLPLIQTWVLKKYFWIHKQARQAVGSFSSALSWMAEYVRSQIKYLTIIQSYNYIICGTIEDGLWRQHRVKRNAHVRDLKKRGKNKGKLYKGVLCGLNKNTKYKKTPENIR